MKHIFPKVRAACRERGIEFTEIDLLWGVTEEEASLGRVIRTCLEEIDRCYPYFIALIGDRYGWIPQLSEVQKDYHLIEQYPWIEDASIDGLSLVEIEIMAGMLKAPKGATGAFVYCRKPEPGAVPNPQLDLLRERIASSGRPVRSFDSLDEMGERVYQDLLAVLERDWPLASGVSELEAERRLQQNFASTRRRAYIANPKQTQVLHDHVAASPGASRGPLVVHDLSGAGKSALMAYFAFHYQRANPGAFVITHFVGASPSGSSAHTILRHIALEIRDRLGVSDELPAMRESLEEALPDWLARMPGELLIILDAVNQLPEPDNLLGWLPEHWPPNVHLIVTSTPCESLDRLRKSGWSELEIGSLSAREREAIIVRFLGEYRKSLGQRQVDSIAKDPKASSPLFLRTLLEELRIAADYDLLEETIEHYLGARDLDELFQFVLERMESDYGTDLVSSILGFIAASRRGLSEPELIELTNIERTKLSVLLLALDYHLMKPNGRFTFFHDYLRRAVHRRYLANPLIERERHRKLAVFFGKHTMMARRFEEEPWQWNACGDKRRLADSLAKLDLLKYAIDNRQYYELLKYWNVTERSAKEYYRSALEELSGNPEEFAPAALHVSQLLASMSDYETAEHLACEALDVCERGAVPGSAVPRSAVLGKALRQLGWILRDRGKLDEAEVRLRQALDLAETQNDTKGIGESLSQLAGLLYLKSNHAEAVALVQRALASGDASRSTAEHRDLIVNLSVALSELGKIDEAEQLLRAALAQCERLEGRTTVYATLANNLGIVLYRKPGTIFLKRSICSVLRSTSISKCSDLTIQIRCRTLRTLPSSCMCKESSTKPNRHTSRRSRCSKQSTARRIRMSWRCVTTSRCLDPIKADMTKPARCS